MEAISDLPMLNDMDADYSPQYVKLARILRAKIESGQYQHGTSYLLPTWHGNMRSPCGWSRHPSPRSSYPAPERVPPRQGHGCP